MSFSSDERSSMGLYHLPLRMRDPTKVDAATARVMRSEAKRIPHGLHLDNAATFRLRSPTESTVSSISSANVPDSATTHTISTLASPISTTYASEVHELLLTQEMEAAKKPVGASNCRILHRHQPSSGTCSTFVNEEEEEDNDAVVTGYPDLDLKMRRLYDSDAKVHEIQQPSTTLTTEDITKNSDPHTPMDSSDLADEGCDDEDADASQDWDNDSTATSDELSGEDGESVLDFTLQLVYGLELREAPISPAVARSLVANFVRDIGRHLASDSQLTHDMSTSSSRSYSSTPSQGSSGNDGRNGAGKRKKPGRRGGGDEDGDEFSDGEGGGFVGVKRLRPNPKEEENLRLSCPYRKRNPHRFNVREHHSCAMTYFPKFAELRQHIVKQHKRDDPSAFVCDRCNRNFAARKELRDHQRLPKELMCDIADHDPESGIDGPTATKLLSRKRASGASSQVQWCEIWHILFPDDEDNQVRPYDFTPVIEHFELSAHYLDAFYHLQTSLRDKISNPATLETLATKFHQCFVETIERCISDAQTKPYANRSNKKNEVLRAAPANNNTATTATNTNRASLTTLQKGRRDVQPRPDSGVVMDDGSEESGSIMGVGLTHHNSVRTAREVPGQIPEAVPEMVPSTAAFGDGFMGMVTAGTMDMAAVQAWTNDLCYQPQPQHIGDTSLGFTSASMAGVPMYQGVPQETTPPQGEYLNWGNTTTFNGMGNGYTGGNY